ncbi:MAG: FAD-dependent thymidylate synthase [Aquificae bacterium]|nr:FAD-dependent thymidylate synthase [Aquificota bacterium]
MRVRLMGSDQRVVRAARVSFARDELTDPERDKRLIRYLYTHRHASPFEHCVVAYEAPKDEWLRLLSEVESPTFQAYWTDGYLFLNLRNALNALEKLPPELVEQLRKAFPTVLGVAEGRSSDEELSSLPYSTDERFFLKKIETPSGWVALVDKLELGTRMDYYTFIVECPLFVARQWMRHRFGSFNELSRRYVGDEQLSFYLPPYLRKQAKKNKQASVEEPVERSEELLKKVHAHAEESKKLYRELLNEGVARELARGVLPLLTNTRFYWTVPRVSLDNFITLRTHEGAQWEIRLLAEAVKKLAGYRGTDRANRL